jgi:hypothetical protein
MNLDHTSPYFNMTIAACRAAGAVGGRRSAQSRRLRKYNERQRTGNITGTQRETAAEAIARIDALCPWLRGAEGRTMRPLSA